MKLVGLSPNGKLVEMIELEEHPWFVAVQFHPEFKSKPDKAHPLFREFVRHALLFQGTSCPSGAATEPGDKPEESLSEQDHGEKHA